MKRGCAVIDDRMANRRVLVRRLGPPALVGFLTRPERFELPTFGSVDRRSIQLSYGRLGAILVRCIWGDGAEVGDY